jgi:anti-sigma B factor antagonist
MFTHSVKQARGNVTVVNLSGKMTVDEGSSKVVHDLVRELAQKGHRNILLNLQDISYVDSSGIGELFGCVTTMQRQDGVLKLSNPNERVSELIRLTKLNSVVEVFEDESTAIVSFPKASAA